MKNFRMLTALFAILMLVYTATGQKLILDIHTFPTIDKNFSPSFILPFNGVSLSLNHGANQRFQGGLSFRSVPWGSEVSLSEGYIFRLAVEEKYVISNTVKVFLGVPLYYNKLSISSGVSSEIDVRLKRFNRIYLSAGIRYNINPSYWQISANNKFLEGLLGLHIVLWK